MYFIELFTCVNNVKPDISDAFQQVDILRIQTVKPKRQEKQNKRNFVLRKYNDVLFFSK